MSLKENARKTIPCFNSTQRYSKVRITTSQKFNNASGDSQYRNVRIA